MSFPETQKYIHIKEASELSGYSTDYIQRLCKAGKIECDRSGKAWLINRYSMYAFVADQQLKKSQRSEELRKIREEEYRSSLKTASRRSPGLPKGNSRTTALSRIRPLHSISHPSFAVALAVLLIGTSAVLADTKGAVIAEAVKRSLVAYEKSVAVNGNVAEKVPLALYELGGGIGKVTSTAVVRAPHTYNSAVLALVSTPKEQSASAIKAVPSERIGERLALHVYDSIRTFFARSTTYLAEVFGIRPRSTLVAIPTDSAEAYPSTDLPAPRTLAITSSYPSIGANYYTTITGASTLYVDAYVNAKIDEVYKTLYPKIESAALSGSPRYPHSTVSSISNGSYSNVTLTNSSFSGSLSATTLSVSGDATFSGTTTFSGPVVFGDITGSTQCLHVNSSGVISGTGSDCGSGGSGITSLKGQYSSAQTGNTQTFATSSDTNLTLTITSSGDTHTFTPGWTGVLSVIRGGTGLSSLSANGLLIADSSGTGFTQVATSSLGLSTTNITEGTNLFYTTARFATALAGTTTDALAEGVLNKYYTDARARAAISATATGLTYNSTTGVITYTGLATTSQPSSSQLLVSNGGAGVYGVATSSATLGLGLSGALTGLGASNSISIATSSLYAGTVNQIPYFTGTNTLGATTTLSVNVGGTGSSTLTGILKGNGTGAIGTLIVGSGLSYDGSTLSANVTSAASTTLLADSNTFSGNNTFSNTITGSITGNAGTATILQTARNINGTSFNGSSDITITAASSTLLANTNTWSGSNTFQNAPVLGSLSGLIAGNSGSLYASATTTASCSGSVSCSDFTILGSSPVTITGSGGGTGLSTSTPVSAGNVLVYSSAGGGYAYGVATTSITVSGPFVVPTGLSGIGSSGAITYTGLATTSQPSSSQLLVSNGGAGVYGVATSSATLGLGLSGSLTALGSSNSLSIATTSLFTWGNSLQDAGNIINTIQDIRTSASPTFTGLTLSGLTSGGLAVDSTGVLYKFSTSSWRFASSTALADSNTFSGNNTFSNTITGSITGNAGTATILQTARNINGVAFNGSSDITITAASSTLLANTNTWSGSNTFNTAPTFNTALGVASGGTGSTTLSGILRGNGTGQVATLLLGAGLSYDGTTLTNTVTDTDTVGTWFTPTTYGNATSTTIGFTQGLLSIGSTTINGNATTTGTFTLPSYTNGALATNAIGQLYTFSTSSWRFASSTALADSNTFSGNNTFSNTITGSITGNAGTATILQTARNINGTSFNGSSDITITAASSTLLANTNTWSGNNTFTNSPVFTSLSGGVVSSNASSDTLYNTATTTLAFSGPFTGASALGTLLGGSNSTIVYTGLATTSQPSSSQLLVSNGGAGVYGVSTTTTGTVSSILALNGIGATTIPFASTTALSSSGSAYFASTAGSVVSIASSSPFSKLSIHANNGDTAQTLFAIGSSTATATSTLFKISNTGAITTSAYTSGGLATDVNGTLYTFSTSSWRFASSTALADSNTFSGNNTFSNTITGSITGNAGTATILQTARNINGTSFNGSSDITITAASSTLLANTNTWSGSNTFNTAPTFNTALGVASGGTGSTTLSGILRGNGTGQVATLLLGAGLTFDGTTLSAPTASAFPFTPATTYGANANSTSTAIWLTSTAPLYASSTVAFGTAGNDLYFNASNGRLGIGNTSPDYKVDVAGFINTDQYSGYKQAGNTVLYASSTNFTTFVGIGAGAGITTATANYSTALGYQALNANTTGLRNIAIGYQALAGNVSTSQQTAIGYQALASASLAGGDNVAVGFKALQVNTGGANNTAVGDFALNANLTGSGAVALGYGAGYTNTAAAGLVAIGQLTAYGNGVNYSNTGSVAIGYQSGYNFSDASDYNTLLGYQAGYDITTGARNIVIGQTESTGSGITTGSNNILIGSDLRTGFSATASNQLNIGNLIFATGTGSGTTLGTGNVGIGTTSPSARLTVNGSSYFAGALLATSTVQLSNYTSGALATDVNGTLYTFSTSTWTFASSTLLANTNTWSGSNSFTAGLTANTLTVSGLSSGLVGNNNGILYSFASSSIFGFTPAQYPFTPLSTYGAVASATTSPVWLQSGLYASSTVAFGTAGNSLTFNSSTGYLGLGTTTPAYRLAVVGDSTEGAPLIVQSSNTSSTGIKLNNTSAGGHSWSISTQGSGATDPGSLTFFDGTANKTGLFVSASTLNLQVTSGATLAFSSSASFATAAPDTGLSRLSANVVAVGNGTQGDVSGTLITKTLGLGTTSPYAKLSIHGDSINNVNTLFAIGSSTATATSTLLTFSNRGILTFGSSTRADIYINGGGTTTAAMLASGNVAIGNQAFSYHGIGDTDNIALGYQALYGSSTTMTAGDDNFAAGYRALYSNNNGNSNIAIGNSALYSNTTGYDNIALGYSTLLLNTTGTQNTAIGIDALGKNTIGILNQAMGNGALYQNKSGSYNVALGAQSLSGNKSATTSTAVGYGAGSGVGLYYNQGGTYLGYLSGYNAGNSSNYNTFVGYQSGYLNTTGYNNIILGTQLNTSGTGYITTGGNNIGIGFNTRFPSATANNQLNIGNFLFGTLPATTTTSAFDLPTSGALGIGSSSPYAKLSITANNGDTAQTLFAIGSSTATATSTLLSISNIGVINLLTNTSATSSLITYGGHKLLTASDDTSTYLGLDSGARSNTTRANTGIGYQSLSSNTSGANNTAVGYQSLYLNTTGASNVAVGHSALYSNQNGQYNVAVGEVSLYNNSNGHFNVALGYSTINSNRSGIHNTALGNQALESASSSLNTALGSQAGQNVTTGTANTLLGYRAGNGYLTAQSFTVGTSSTFIGSYSGALLTSISTSTAIGAGSLVGQSNSIVLGGFGQDSVFTGIGTSSPYARLSVHANAADSISNNTLFAIGSSTATATTTLLSVNNTGTVSFNLNAGTSTLFTFAGQSFAIASSTGFNTALGRNALKSVVRGANNTALGDVALFSNQYGSDNTGIGSAALYYATSSSNNTAVGSGALLGDSSDSSGGFNVAIGYRALYANSRGLGNTSAGWTSLNSNTTGSYNTGFGYETLLANSVGEYNVVLGYRAGRTVTGNSNILLGAHVSTANVITSGLGNIGIGNELFFPSATANNQLNIGNLIYGTLPATSTALLLPTSGALGIGSSSPYAKLSITANNGDTAQTLFAIGSSTASATTTLFTVSNTGSIFTQLGTGCVSATAGVLSASGSCGGYPFTPLSTYGAVASATTSPVWFQSGLYASSTVAFGSGSNGFYFNASNGRFGIGTTAPAQPIHVVGKGTSLGAIRIDNTGSGAILVANRTDGYATGLQSGNTGGNFAYETGGIFKILTQAEADILDGGFTNIDTQNTKFVIDTTGHTGIATSSPFARLSVHANYADSAPMLFAIGSSTATATTTLFTVSNTGNVGIGSAPPSWWSSPGDLYVSGRIRGEGGYSAGSATNFTWGDGFQYITGTDSAGLDFTTGSTLRMSIANGGNVGIASSTPFAKFSIHGDSINNVNTLFAIGSSTATATSTVFNVTNAGFVGIGAANSGNLPLYIQTAGGRAAYAEFSDSSGAFLDFGLNGGGAGVFWQNTAAPLVFGTNNTERVRIDSAGYVGIGSTSPWRTLSVSGTVGFQGLTAGSGDSLCLSSNFEVVTCTAAAGAAYAFYPRSTYGTTTSATTSPLYTTGGFFASTTSSSPSLTITQSGSGPAATFMGGNVGIGTTSPYEKFAVDGNIVLTGNFLPSVAPTMSATSQTQTVVDSTNDTGSYSSIAIGSDGYPVISYYDNTSFDLKVTKCGNAACSSGNTTTSVDTTGTVGLGSSIAVPADGLPVISYYDSSNGDLKVIKCGNAACSSGNTTTSVDTTNNTGHYTSIAISADGYPIIAYQYVTSGDLKVLKCGNAACSSGNTATVLDTTGGSGQWTDIAIAADGYAVISHFDSTNSDLRVAKCLNVLCTSSTNTLVAGSASTAGDYTSIAVPADGLPIISYYYGGGGDLAIVKCSNSACTASTPNTPDTTGTVGDMTSIAIGSDGFPVVSYRDSTNGDLKVMKCNSNDCNAGATITTVESTNSVGSYTSIAIGTDGLPVVAYREYTSGDLKVTKCANLACTSTASVAPSGGSSIGSGSQYFNDVYAYNYFGKKFTISNFDLAESYEVREVGAISPGDIVAFDEEGKLVKAGSEHAVRTVGIVSTAPGLLLSNWAESADTMPVALAGRVPINVVASSTPLKPGDLVTLSSEPGLARKARPGEISIGVVVRTISDTQVEVMAHMQSESLMELLTASSTDSLNGEGIIDTLASLVGGAITSSIDRVSNAFTVGTSASTTASSTILTLYEGTSNPAITVDATGKVGIGTSTPLHALDVHGSIFASGSIASDTFNATRYLVPVDVASFTFASSSIPEEVLTADGTSVDIFALAGFTYAKVEQLSVKVDALTLRVDSLEEELAALKQTASTEVATTSPTLTDDFMEALLDALTQFGILIKDGLAQFKAISAEQFIARSREDGTSSAGQATVQPNTTSIVISNGFVHPSSKIFITFNGPVTGSWYVTNKQEGAFTMEFTAPQASTVTFDYFILQTDESAVAAAAAPGTESATSTQAISTTTPASSAPVQTPEVVEEDATPVPPPQVEPAPATDTTAPVITLLGMTTTSITVGSTWTDRGATALDNIDGDVTSSIIVEGTVDTETEGTYTVTYSVSDSSGNGAMAVRTVVVGPPLEFPTPFDSVPAGSTELDPASTTTATTTP